MLELFLALLLALGNPAQSLNQDSNNHTIVASGDPGGDNGHPPPPPPPPGK